MNGKFWRTKSLLDGLKSNVGIFRGPFTYLTHIYIYIYNAKNKIKNKNRSPQKQKIIDVKKTDLRVMCWSIFGISVREK